MFVCFFRDFLLLWLLWFLLTRSFDFSLWLRQLGCLLAIRHLISLRVRGQTSLLILGWGAASPTQGLVGWLLRCMLFIVLHWGSLGFRSYLIGLSASQGWFSRIGSFSALCDISDFCVGLLLCLCGPISFTGSRLLRASRTFRSWRCLVQVLVRDQVADLSLRIDNSWSLLGFTATHRVEAVLCKSL